MSSADAETARPAGALSLAERAGVAVIRLRSLGDTVLSTPAIHELKRWRPDLRIAYVVEQRFAAAVQGNPDISEVIAVPQRAGRYVRTLFRLRNFHPTIAINLHGGNSASWLTFGSGARYRVTFAGGHNVWAHNVRTRPVAPTDGRRRLHTAEHVASLFQQIGVPIEQLGRARVPISVEAQHQIRQRLAAEGVKGQFVFVNSRARAQDMRWQPERYAEVLRRVFQRCGHAAVFAREAADDGFEEQILRALPSQPAAILTGTGVEDLIALEAEAEWVLGSDGGPIHIAAALGKPIVVLYSTTDVEVWHPWQTRFRMLQSPGMQMSAAEVLGAVEALATETQNFTRQ